MKESQTKEERDSTEKAFIKQKNKKLDAMRMPFIFKCLLVIMLTLSLLFFATKLVEYNRLRQETEKLQEEIKDHEENAAELRYLIDSPVDDAYIIRVAREKLGLVFPDEDVFFSSLPQDN